MEIFVRHDQQEIGPLTRDEVFALLREGKLLAEDEARDEDAIEWKPLMEILNKGAAKLLFSVEQIEANYVSLPPPTLIVDLSPRRSSVEKEEPTWNGRKVILWATAGMAAAFYIAFVFNQDREATTPASSQSQTTVVAPMVQAPNGSGTVAGLPPTPQVRPAEPARFPEGASPPPAAVAGTFGGSISAPQVPVPGVPPPASSSPIAQAPLMAAQQLLLPALENVEKSSLWLAGTVPQPRAILVLILDPKDKAESFARNKEWQTFARQNGWGLAAVTFASKEAKVKGKTVTVLPDLNQGLGSALLAALDSAWGQAPPLIVYGRYGAGTLATKFAQWKPNRMLFWAAYSNEWKEAPIQDKAPVPALIACDREGTQHSNEAQVFFAKGRSLKKPWTWLCLNTPPKERAALLDRFFRDYIHAYLRGTPDAKSGSWTSIATLRPMTTLDLMTKPGEASWLPDAQLMPAWTELMSAPSTAAGPATILQRSVATRNPKQPTLDLYLRLPRSNDKQPITGILAFCTWEKDQAAILSKLDIQVDDKAVDLPGPAALVRSIIRYAEDHHMAVLTWGTAEAWDNHVNTDELEREKQREFDRNFDLLANAWERGVKELSHEAGGIPTNNMLLYGMSRGAQWAHRLALRKPDYFLAVHVHIPSTFDKPTPEGNRPLWLVTTGELEYGYDRAQSFYRECEALNYPIIFKAIVGIGHQGSPIADALGLKFFDYALTVKAQRDDYGKSQKDALARLAKPSPGPWLKSFREPEFLGDFVNQECLPVAQAEMIPKSFRVPLPNKILADAWNQ
ncbi:MAG: hypothetical protein P4L99_17120 [Chthoniobacter sp.]|nr:hypothetical protein [Chthoniobacter sp.]